MPTKFEAFAALHVPGDPVVLYNIWDAGSAKAVAAAGAKALATGSHPVGDASGFGDGQLVPLDFVFANARRIMAAVDLPLLGRVAAGRPIEALEVADTIAVPEDFIRRQNTFVLRVVGSSMVGDGILDGDYIVVEERPSAENGETVVATLNGEATVKRFYRERPGKIRLQPANDAMSPIIARDKDVEVRGVVVAVLRKY